MKNILAFSGSNSSKSINHLLLTYAVSLIENHEVKLIDLRDYDVPIFSTDLETNEGLPKNIKDLEKLISKYDVLMIALPEHNGSMSSFFKNILDWLTRVNHQFLKNKKLVLLSTSPGKHGAKFGLEHTASILPRFGGELIDTYNLGSFYDTVNLENGFELKDDGKWIELKGMIDKL
jgi:chromate reductase, NAD(P)H dehydrogenase (quinone)